MFLAHSTGLHTFQSQERQQRDVHGMQTLSLTSCAAAAGAHVKGVEATGEACTTACGRTGA